MQFISTFLIISLALILPFTFCLVIGGCNLIMFTHSRTEERATGWYRLTREILKLPDASSKESSKDKSQKMKRPQPLIKLVMRRFKNSIAYF